MYNSLNSIDLDSNKYRGFIVLSKKRDYIDEPIPNKISLGKRTFKEIAPTKVLGISLKQHLNGFDDKDVRLMSKLPVPRMKQLISLLNSEDVKI